MNGSNPAGYHSNISNGAVLPAGAITRRCAPLIRYTLWRNTASINEMILLQFAHLYWFQLKNICFCQQETQVTYNFKPLRSLLRRPITMYSRFLFVILL